MYLFHHVSCLESDILLHAHEVCDRYDIARDNCYHGGIGCGVCHIDGNWFQGWDTGTYDISKNYFLTIKLYTYPKSSY